MESSNAPQKRNKGRLGKIELAVKKTKKIRVQIEEHFTCKNHFGGKRVTFIVKGHKEKRALNFLSGAMGRNTSKVLWRE